MHFGISNRKAVYYMTGWFLLSKRDYKDKSWEELCVVVANDLKCSDPMTLSCGKISTSLVRQHFEYAVEPLIPTYKVELKKSNESKKVLPKPKSFWETSVWRKIKKIIFEKIYFWPKIGSNNGQISLLDKKVFNSKLDKIFRMFAINE